MKQPKVAISPQQRREFERLVKDFRFQDEFIQKTLQQLQLKKDPTRYGRLWRFWEDSRRALEAYSQQGDLAGFRRVIHANQDFIDQILAGKVKLFDVPEPIS